MNCTQITYEVADGVCTITLARPDKLNAFTGTMGDELYEAFRQAHADPLVRAIVLTGAGSAFCAGVDMKALADPAEAARIVAGPFLGRFPRENYRSATPTICAINGPAIGVGVTMSLSFDLRIAAEDAKLAVPFTKLGMLPGLGSTYLLPRLVGRGAALDLLLSGRTISAVEARDIGLVERTVPPGTALEVAAALARDLAQRNPVVLAGVKEAVNFGAEHTLEESMDNEEALIAKLRFTKRAPAAS